MTDQLPRYIKPTNPQGPSNKREDTIYERGREDGVASQQDFIEALHRAGKLAMSERDKARTALAEALEVVRALLIIPNYHRSEDEHQDNMAKRKRARTFLAKYGGTDE